MDRSEWSPLSEADHLDQIARESDKEHPRQEGEPGAIRMYLDPHLRAEAWRIEAKALRRGYNRGRLMAAFETRMGLDQSHLNGSVRFDSDTQPPPDWLCAMASRLARGDAR